MSAVIATGPARTASLRRTPAWIITDSISIAWRNMLAVLRNPQLLVIDTVTPVMFVLLFAFVFGARSTRPASTT